MLHWWWDNAEERRWTTLVQALAKSGSRVLASTIAVKHSKFFMELNVKVTLPFTPINRCSSASIKEYRHNRICSRRC